MNKSQLQEYQRRKRARLAAGAKVSDTANGLFLDGILISTNQNYTGNIDFELSNDGLFIDEILISADTNYTGNINFGA